VENNNISFIAFLFFYLVSILARDPSTFFLVVFTTVFCRQNKNFIMNQKQQFFIAAQLLTPFYSADLCRLILPKMNFCE
jgi:hypothetical protein